MKILSFGEILWDIYPEKTLIGGAIFNCSAHLSRLGASSYLMSAIGDDKLGIEALSSLNKFNIKTDYINKSKKQSGQCVVHFDENNAPYYDILDDTALDDITSYLKSDNKSFDAVCFGTLSQRKDTNLKKLNDVLEEGNFKEVFCDVNIRPPFYSDKVITFCLDNATILKISREELPIIQKAVSLSEEGDYTSFAKTLCNKFINLKVIIITLDKDGAYVYDCKNGNEYRQKAQKVKTVSSVGAGDSFSAGFLYQYLSGQPLEKCLDSAVKLSAFVVTKVETVPEYDKDEIFA